MSTLLTIVAEMRAKHGREDDLRKAAMALVEPTRKEEGCVQYDLHEHKAEPGRFVFYENWVSEADLARHAASEHLSAFREISADLLEDPPSVQPYQRIA